MGFGGFFRIVLGGALIAISLGAAGPVIASFLGTSGVLFGGSLVLGGIAQSLAPNPGRENFNQSAAGMMITSRQPIAPWQVIYGRRRVGGVITFLDVTGTDNEFLHVVITLACHEVDAIEKMYFDGVEIPLDGGGDATGDFAGFAHAKFNLGDPDQAAFSGLVADSSNWTTNHRQRNRAGAYVRVKWEQSLYANGLPNINFDIRGRKVYDPRLGYTIYSVNPALCEADFLSKKENFTVRSREYEDAAWIKSASITVTATNISAPDSSLTARELTTTAANQSIRQNGIIPPEVDGRQVVYTVWLRKFSGSDVVNFRVKNQADTDRFALFTQSVTTTWKKFVLAGTMGSSDTEIRVVIDGMDGAAGAEFEIWESQVRYGTVDGPMLHTGELANIDPPYGFNASWEEIDETALITAADVCDENVTLDAGGTEDRYTCNGVFLTSEKRLATLRKLVASMAGTLVPISGKWTMYAGEWRAPTISLDESDLRGPIKVQGLISKRELFNAVKGVQVTEANDWQPSDFPPLTDSTFEAEDNNERIWRDIELPYTTSSPTAQRLAKIELQRARKQTTVMAPWKMSAYQVQPGDTVQVSNSRFGWATKNFEVTQSRFAIDQGVSGAPTLGINMQLRESESTVYDWNEATEEQVPKAKDTSTLPVTFLADRLNFRTSAHSTYRPFNPTDPLSATDAGSDVSIVIANFTMRTPEADISVTGSTLTARSFDTLYYVFYDDPTFAGGSVTFETSTTKEDAINDEGRFYVGSILTPVDGGFDTEGNDDGGAGAQFGLTIGSRPTAEAVVSAGGYNSPTLAFDRDLSTDASKTVATGGGGTHEHRWDTFSATAEGVFGTEDLTLYIISRVNIVNSPTSPRGRIRYSTNSGSTWTDVYDVTVARADTKDPITLPARTDLSKLQIEGLVGASNADGTNFITHTITAIWVAGKLQ